MNMERNSPILASFAALGVGAFAAASLVSAEPGRLTLPIAQPTTQPTTQPATQPGTTPQTRPAAQPERRDGMTDTTDRNTPRAQPGQDVRTNRPPMTQQTLDAAMQGWDPKQQDAIRKTAAKYGMPTEVTPDTILWKNPAPFKYICVEREMVDHRFPMPHPDFLRHAVAHRIPADKVSALIASDGSLMVDRTGGILSAKCDTEPHNLLSLNLAHDVLMGTKTADEARAEHARIAMGEKNGESHPYLERLQFQPDSEAAAMDPDAPYDASRPMNRDATSRPATPATNPNDRRAPGGK